ncbi:family 16 glycosylhydrolase [Sinomicrobium soli]|uniref:family 16 glycosylhydrolase n=1 Tax=Sinomicrobium sp. N-1-3-6 TaxID=2219864 RepID=UPI000DCB0182|nr:family 16 glycosylhydrolase [Sinomicrobium sp. N-1-3-6]RAV30903.1 glycoside hydrolase family 16 protein [Sinomicrobium sp. N-1-3-6]
MKRFPFYISTLLAAMLFLLHSSCQDDDNSLGDITAPSGLNLEARIIGADDENEYGDGSGLVEFLASAEHATNYKFTFSDKSSELATSGNYTHRFTTPGVNDYIATVIASGTGGVSTSKTINLTVFSEFDDPETKALLTGESSKTWYLAKALPAHLGVGPAEGFSPDYYSATPFEKGDCFYNDELTFSLDSNGNIVFEQDNKGETFFNADYLSVGGGSGGEDACLPFDTSGNKFVNLAPAVSEAPGGTGTQLIISDGGFMSYYIGASAYDILTIEEDYMEVRAIMGSNSTLAWYLKFTTDPEGGGNNGGEEEMLETRFENLVWSDEFDEGSAPDPANWNFETGNNNGWGNNESQYYTEDNAVIDDGVLSINLVAESINGYNYSSSRITTHNKFDFTYGRVEVRAKLTEGGGTWPAIWMLGSNFQEVEWPGCGEIDIMEYVANQHDVIHGTLHFPGNFAGNAVSESTVIDDVASDFHNYTVEWTEDQIIFAVDNKIFHKFDNTPDTPFHNPFFLILNVAMGGTFGGEIDPAFEQSSMEVEYVRVYQ